MSTDSRPLLNREPSPEPVSLVADHPRSAAGSSGLAWRSVPAGGHRPDEVLAAFAVLLYKYTGQADLLFDAELAGRSGALSLAVEPDLPGQQLLATARHGPARRHPGSVHRPGAG